MKKRTFIRKAVSLSLAVGLAMGSLAGCGGSGTSDNGSSTASQPADNSSTSGQAGDSSDSDGSSGAGSGSKLTCWVKMDATKIGPTTDNFGTIQCYQEIAKNTGVDVQFIHPPTGQESDSFSLLIAGGEYPDMIHYDWGNAVAGGPDKAIEEGVILELSDLIEQNCPNLKAFLEKYPEIKATMTTDKGNIYCFPNVYPYFEDDTLVVCNRGYQIRQDWLDELGLEAPETIDEWHTVLTAFKNKGTNEDGNPIVPMVSRKLSEKTSMVRTFANAWGGLDYDFYVDNGVVKFGPIEPAFKDYLATMNQWYEEGLIASEFSTITGKEVDAMITTNQAGAWFFGLGAGMGVYITALGGDDSKISGVKFPVAAEGDTPKYTSLDNYPFVGFGTAISTKCQDVEAACKWLDYHYSEEGNRLLNWGIEGVSYELDENGLPQFTDEILHNPDGLSADVALGKYAMVSQLEAFAKDHRAEAIRMWVYPAQEEASRIWNETDFTYRYPPTVSLTPEESSELAGIMSDITTYRDENVIRFILGSESIDNYDKFAETIQKMNISRAIEIKQAAYDRLQKRLESVK
ncbi:MAG: extracellular solute-binding protein [Lachnospiraceae bacterium]|nr:extracellular solute-binding protein [Lachnospiraceae bacterium]